MFSKLPVLLCRLKTQSRIVSKMTIRRNLFNKSDWEEKKEDKVDENNKVEEIIKENKIDEKDEKILKLETQLKYLMAEVQNIQKRVKKQVDEAKDFGVSKFMKDMFEVADILETVVENTPKEIVEKKCRNEESEKFKCLLKELLTGLEMTISIMNKKFEIHGIEKCCPLGEPFDHNLHLAKFQIPKDNSKYEPGIVGEVMRVGYKYNGRLLRAAEVGVVKK